jgi:hypothetical protein
MRGKKDAGRNRQTPQTSFFSPFRYRNRPALTEQLNIFARFSSSGVTMCQYRHLGLLRPSTGYAVVAKPASENHKSQSLAGQVGYALEGGFMNTNDILLTIDAEILRLQQAKALLTNTSNLTHARRKPGRPANASRSGKATSFNPADFDAKPRKRRGMSAAGRARIAAAQKARWARFKKAEQ